MKELVLLPKAPKNYETTGEMFSRGQNTDYCNSIIEEHNQNQLHKSWNVLLTRMWRLKHIHQLFPSICMAKHPQNFENNHIPRENPYLFSPPTDREKFCVDRKTIQTSMNTSTRNS
ncbi:CLUMA_CG017716, isoform A [Clunio marinus]|uniref:CLUMA_CG017716, isoform A n=1 Tax=Clunio marinus TaxID=568069 RepID=A0A1J1IYL9_9DIPT|nr:CLUMA_CG017716, isoform A [Clunio marinus]